MPVRFNIALLIQECSPCIPADRFHGRVQDDNHLSGIRTPLIYQRQRIRDKLKSGTVSQCRLLQPQMNQCPDRMQKTVRVRFLLFHSRTV